jgi:hypothetical protein
MLHSTKWDDLETGNNRELVDGSGGGPYSRQAKPRLRRGTKILTYDRLIEDWAEKQPAFPPRPSPVRLARFNHYLCSRAKHLPLLVSHSIFAYPYHPPIWLLDLFPRNGVLWVYPADHGSRYDI